MMESMDRLAELSSTWLSLLALATWRALPILLLVVAIGLAFRRRITLRSMPCSGHRRGPISTPLFSGSPVEHPWPNRRLDIKLDGHNDCTSQKYGELHRPAI